MLRKEKSQRWTWLTGILSMLALAFSASAADPYYYAVQASATISTSPARITLNWPADGAATGYTISRKAFGSSSWSQVATLGGSATTWTDSNVAVGGSYEYGFNKTTSGGYTGTGYIYTGVNAPLADTRGRVMLVVDNTYAGQLATELARFEQDLIGDGWTVVRQNVNRADSPATVKNYIKNVYNNGGLRSVILFGHVAVPYSGNLNPDGHPDHVGAWPADVYYGDMDGNWTDNSVNNTSSAKAWNHNVPGDGKFDQTSIPSDVELEVGRIDLSNMTCFSNKTPSRSELDLLRQYLNKDNNFRHGRLNVQRRGTVCDNFGVPYGEAFAAAGWRLSSAFFGAANSSVTPGGQFFSNLSQNSYLFAYACGGGSFYTCAGVGSSDDFAVNDVKAVFTLFLGSYFADWDNESNFMRAALGGTTYTLTAGWSGRPEWWLHHMALGETIGYGTRLSQNNNGVYNPQYQSTRGVHIGLLGDPTLRLHPVMPVGSLQGVTVGSTVTLAWTPSSDENIVGYHVYRATSANGTYTRLTSSPVALTTYVDISAPSGAVYMVRAIKLENSGSGAYYNASQGIFYTAGTTGGGTVTIPVAPSNFSATSLGANSIRVAWSDNSANETGFQIERKAGASGTYATVNTTGANASSLTDSGLTQGTQYYYRLSAVNTAGLSATVEATANTSAASGGTATANYVTTDSTTQGTWKGTYGSEGAYIVADSSSLPAYGLITPPSAPPWTWTYSNTDSRDLQRVSAGDRIAACWNVDGSFNVDVNITDGQAHRLAMYFLDWDNNGRVQNVEVLDANTGAVLDSKSLSSFGSGKYLVYDVKGNVRIRVTKVSGVNAVMSGLFFGPASQTAASPTATMSVAKSASGVTVRVNGTTGQTFRIERSTDLVNWNNPTTVTLSGTSYDFTDTTTGNKFYRAISQ